MRLVEGSAGPSALGSQPFCIAVFTDGFATAGGGGAIDTVRALHDDLTTGFTVFRLMRTLNLSFYVEGFGTPAQTASHFGIRTDDSGELEADVAAVADAVAEADCRERALSALLSGTAQHAPSNAILLVLAPAPASGEAGARRYTAHPADPDDPDSTAIPIDFIVAENGPGLAAVVAQQIGFAIGLGSEAPSGNPSGLVAPDLAEGRYRPPVNLVLVDDPADPSAWRYEPLLDDFCWPDSVASLTLVEVAGDAPDESGLGTRPPSRGTSHLFEGGDGYASKVYRLYRDCVMRRQLGSSALPLRGATVDFCPTCKGLIERRLTFSRTGPPLDQQLTWYDKVTWSNLPVGDPASETLAGSGPWTFDSAPGGAEDYWIFTVSNAPGEGLRFTDLMHRDERTNVHDHDGNAPHMSDANAIALAMEFRDARVVVDTNGTETAYWVDPKHLSNDPGAPFAGDVVRATATIVPGSEQLFYGENGSIGNDDLWQYGFKRVTDYDIEGKVVVTVEQAVAFHGAASDFDPPGAVVAIKVLPQFAFRWRCTDGQSTVKSFHGAVWQNMNPIATVPHGDEAPPEPDVPLVQSTWFTEMHLPANTSALDDDWFSPLSSRVKHGNLGRGGSRETLFSNPLSSFFATLFAYTFPMDLYTGNEQGRGQSSPYARRPDPPAKEVLAVRHGDQSEARTQRYGWQKIGIWDASGPKNNFEATLVLERQPRTGQYDNIHNHGWMGLSEIPSDQGTSRFPDTHVPRLMAPTCGEACIHTHWRWLWGAYAQHLAMSPRNTHEGAARYHGWGDDPLLAHGNSVEANPMLPPNQRLRVAITHPAYDRLALSPPHYETVLRDGSGVDREREGIMVDLPRTNDDDPSVPSPLPRDQRAMWYDVDIEGHIEENAPQVTFENGWGFAIRHTLGSEIEYLAREAADYAAGNWLLFVNEYPWAYAWNETAFDTYNPLSGEYTRAYVDAMMTLYDDWRFYLNGVEQSPRGDHDADPGGNTVVPMEKL